MNWKKLDSWKKGGLIGLATFLVLFIIEGLIRVITHGGKCTVVCPSGGGACFQTFSQCFSSSISYRIIPSFLFISFAKMGISQQLLNDILNSGITIIIVLLLYFLIGALIGLIVGKIKK